MHRSHKLLARGCPQAVVFSVENHQHVCRTVSAKGCQWATPAASVWPSILPCYPTTFKSLPTTISKFLITSNLCNLFCLLIHRETWTSSKRNSSNFCQQFYHCVYIHTHHFSFFLFSKGGIPHPSEANTCLSLTLLSTFYGDSPQLIAFSLS